MYLLSITENALGSMIAHDHPSLSEEYMRLLQQIHPASEAEHVEMLNHWLDEHHIGIRLYTTGHKDRCSAERKSQLREMKDWQLTDLTRLSVITRTPELADAFKRHIVENAHDYEYFSVNGWRLKGSGLLSSGLRVGFDGIVGQIHIGEEYQDLHAHVISHRLYRV